MTRIDFYILAPDSHRNVEQLTCQLAEKAYLQNSFTYINSRSIEQANSLDELLWTFKSESFLPHAIQSAISEQIGGQKSEQKTDDFDYPILINVSDSIPDGLNAKNRSELLINLTDTTPSFFSQFHRLAEVVDKDEKSKQDARERFRFYKERGYEIATHNV